MFNFIRSSILFFICGLSGSSWANIVWDEGTIFTASNGGYYGALTQAQAPVTQYLRTILYDVAYPGSPQYSGALLGTGPIIVLDRPAFEDVMGPQPYFNPDIGDFEAPNSRRGGVGFTPDCPTDCWDPAAQAWAIPFNATGIVGLELLYKPYVNGSPLSQPPVVGQPLPGLVTTSVGDADSGLARLPSLRVELQVRATSRFGQDLQTEHNSDIPWGYDPGLDLGGNNGLLPSNIGRWIEYFEKSPGGPWGVADDNLPSREVNHQVNADHLRVYLGASSCFVGNSRLNGEVDFTRGSAMTLTLPAVANSSFSGAGSTQDGPDSLGGSFLFSCYKYDFQNVTLTVTASSAEGDFSKGVVLTDPGVAGRSSNVGVQLLLALGPTDQAAPTTPFQEFQIGTNNLGHNPGNLFEYFKNGGILRLPSGTVQTANARRGVLAFHFKPRYYKIGQSPAEPGVVQATYTINMDYQ